MRAVGTLVMAALVALGSAGTAGASGAHADLEAQFVARINELRASQGLAPLEVHPNLVGKARSWAATMAGEGRIRHSTLPDGITADWQTLGENVGMGPSVQSLHDAFVASPSHYENLVKPAYRYVGIGIVVDAAGTIFVAEEFMTLKPVSPSPPPPPPAPSPDTPSPKAAPARLAAASSPAEAVEPGRFTVVLRHLRTLDG